MVPPLVLPRRVLVVDDCAVNRRLLATILGYRQVAFDEAIDGLEALVKLDEGDFDLVLMDVRMPIMDGFAAVKAFRERQPERQTPVIAITASVGDLGSSVYDEAGFNGRIHKPFAISDIDAVLSQYARAASA